jgi:hypothetical protein
MGNAALISPRLHWIVTLGIAIVLLGLTTHLIAHAVLGPYDVTNNLPGAQSARCSFMAGSALPATMLVTVVATLVVALAGTCLAHFDWFSPPPIHPPIALS